MNNYSEEPQKAHIKLPGRFEHRTNDRGQYVIHDRLTGQETYCFRQGEPPDVDMLKILNSMANEIMELKESVSLLMSVIDEQVCVRR